MFRIDALVASANAVCGKYRSEDDKRHPDADPNTDGDPDANANRCTLRSATVGGGEWSRDGHSGTGSGACTGGAACSCC